MIKTALIIPALFGVLMAGYHLFGEYWNYTFAQIYTRGAQFGLIIGLLWVTANFMPKTIKNAYKYGYSSYFIFVYLYRILMALGITIFNEFWNHIFWVLLCVLFILFSLYLLTKKPKLEISEN